MTDSKTENQVSLSPAAKNLVRSQMVEGIETSPLSSRTKAYERLKVLYKVSKQLSFFESIERTIPQILILCSETLPITTAILVENRGDKISSMAWHAEGIKSERIELALSNCRKTFAYLVGISELDLKNLMLVSTSSEEFSDNVKGRTAHKPSPKNYVALPLIVDSLPPFGVVQLEGADLLDESDLEFMDSLTALIAVAVDRYYKTQYANETRKRESKESSAKLGLSEAHVSDLENERDLRERFVSLLSHDLRTPLSSARICAQLIQRQPDNTEFSLTLAARIVANINRMDQMITDLLDANRIRSGEKLPLQTEHFELSELAKRTADELATIHGDRFILKSSGSIEGHWDRQSLRRVFENLCNNAVKYGSAEGPITITLMQIPGETSIAVQNTGEVILPEDQKLIFQQYRRSQSAQGSDRVGWGMGLTLVRGVAEAHGGSVELTSDADNGTIFTVRLPSDARNYLESGPP